jgi:hypothetical protein
MIDSILFFLSQKEKRGKKEVGDLAGRSLSASSRKAHKLFAKAHAGVDILLGARVLRRLCVFREIPSSRKLALRA